MSRRYGTGLMGGVCFGLIMTLAGCGRPSAGGGVAVVNMAGVLQATGYGQVIQQATVDAQKVERDKFNQKRQVALAALAKVDADISLSPAERDKRHQDTNQQMQAAIQAANAAVEQARSEAIGQFREKVKACAKQVAAASGRSVVIELNDTILEFEPAADITNDVIAQMPPAPAVKPTIQGNPWPEPGQTPAGGPTTAPVTGPATGPAPSTPH